MKCEMRALVVVCLVAVVTGCRPEPATTPEGVYRGFIEALQRGNGRKAWASLSKPTQQKVAARSKAIAAASKGVVSDEPELLLFQGSRPATIEAIEQLRADEQAAVLRVTSGGGTREVKLLKDSGRWVIDLADTLEGSNPP